MSPVFLAFAAFVLAATLASIALATWRLSRRSTPLMDAPGSVPVSIVRPVCGLEPFSRETLGSAFRLDHDEYEIVFCVASTADPIVPLVEELIAAHPERPSRLLVGDDRFSGNPKLNNCLKGWNAARHEWVVLADSNVLMPTDYLGRLLTAWRPDSGLVCSTPLGTRPSGFWAEVECAFLNTLQARWQYAGEAVGLGFAQGKSMLLYRPFLEPKGGLRAFAAEVAEDAAATKLVRDAGGHVHLVDRPFDQPLGRRRARDVWARQLRWARLRRLTFPAFFLPELFSGPAVPALAAAFGAAAIGVSPAGAAAALVAAWWAAEIGMAKKLGWHLSWRFPAALAMRDLLIPPLWVAAFLTRSVVWRGNILDLAPDAANEPVASAARI